MVKVLLGWEQKEILDLLGKMIGIGQSEAMTTVIMEYAKVIQQRMRRFNGHGKLVEKTWLSGADKRLSVSANQRQITQKNVH